MTARASSSSATVRSGRALIVLAGGQSSRFGSEKPFQILAGKPLICHVIDRLSNLADDVIVVIGRGEPRVEYSALLPDYVRVMNDELEGKNPLVGIVTGLRAFESDYAAVLACDTPFVNRAVVELLFQRALNADAAIPRWNNGQIEPLQAVYRRLPAIRAAQEALADKDSSHREMISRLEHVVYVSVEDQIGRVDPGFRSFFNINTKEDMSIAQRMLDE
jgi:molybdopterin-guanine dinucleotide biosynthesis protein A